jgi:hypothetical protein
MHRSTLLSLVLGPSLLGCAFVPARSGSKMPEPPALALSYRVLDGENVVLKGRSQVDGRTPTNGMRVDTLAAHTTAREELELDTQPRDDGTMVVQMRYQEVSEQGAKIDWKPSVRVARGVTARAAVGGVGWGRLIEVSAE